MAVGAIPGGRVPSNSVENLASRSARIYDPPVVSPRAFELDYPSGGVANESGKLSVDIDGNPLVARTVVGRRVLGGADEALTSAELVAITEEITGNKPASVARGQIGGNAGLFRVSFDQSGSPT